MQGVEVGEEEVQLLVVVRGLVVSTNEDGEHWRHNLTRVILNITHRKEKKRKEKKRKRKERKRKEREEKKEW